MKKNILLIALISLLFISCENALSNINHSSIGDNSTNNPAVTTTPSENGKTYISLGDIRFATESRTINPSYIIDNLSSVYLKSKRSASDSSFGTLISNASSYSDACSRSLEIEPGIWDFRLSAYLYDFEFAGTTTVEVEAGTINTLNFDLVTTNTSSYPYGLIDITVDFTGNADKVVATLKEKSTSATAKLTKTYTATDTTNPITSVEGEDFRRINFRTAKSSSSGVTTGKYYLLFEFYNDETLVNSIENIVRVENNFTTKATLNLSLDSLYSVNYKFYKEDDGSDTELTVASGQSIPEGVDFEIAGSVLSNKVSTKSTLPNLTYPGYTFAGWYKATPFTAENKITSIPSDLSSSPTFYAYFVSAQINPNIYVGENDDPDNADGTLNNPFATLADALSKIEDNDSSQTAYTIFVNGAVSMNESTTIDITKAISLTITGKTGTNSDSLDGITNALIPLSVDTDVPVTIKNLTIKGGVEHGIEIKSGTVTLDEGAKISNNNGSGVIISGGELIMLDGEISSNTADHGAGVYITYDESNKTLGKFTMSGGTIKGNTAQYGCGGGVLVDGTLYAEPEELAEYTGGDGNGHVLFTMSNGTISGNEENSTVTDDYEVGVGGGGVCVAGQYAKFVMSDSAVIKANTAPAYGAGVSVWNCAQFIMNGGTIGGSSPSDGNITGEEVEMSTYGGGVYLGGDETSSFTMNNGTISNNKCQGLGADPTNTDTRNNCGGAGVGIFYGTFTMVNGSISNNTSNRHGGGIYIAGHGVFDMQGGSISGNTCTDNGKAINQNWVSNSGVTYYGQLKMKGNAVVASNNDVYLCDKLTITGSLSGTAPVATLTPASYFITADSDPLIEVSADSGTSVGSEYSKFAITPDGSNNYELSNEGKLVASSNGGNSGGGNGATPEYVNLGLPSGTLWATMNVGATSVTDIGTHYEWMDGGVDLGQLSSGATMPSANDMATINLGETWVMPTKEQFEELYEYCYFEPVTSYKGVNVSGYVVFRAKNSSHAQVFTGCGLYNIESNKKEGYSVETDPHIFIPAESDDVYLWASTYAGDSYGGRDQNAYCFFLVDQYEPVETEIIKTTTTDDWEKHPVRPVSTKKGDFVFVEGATISNPPEAFGEYGAFKYVSESSPIVIQNFYMCTHEVTQEEYEKYCIYGGTAPSQTTDKDQYPAYNINWYDAIVYCNLRSLAENLTPVYSVGKAGSSTQSVYPSDWDSIRSSVVNGKTKYCGPDERNSYWDSYFNDEVITINSSANGYRLPTNAEWEYAARGGHGFSITQTQFSGSSTLSEVSNGLYETIEKIKQHKKNILGIYDMNSAVNEWFLDPSGEDDYRRISTAQDPIDYNAAVNPNERSTNSMKLGFRVVRNAQ